MIYREFWYFSRIFPTLFSQLISIFMSLLHTFSMGVKIDARLPRSERFASIMRRGILLLPPVSAGVLEPLKKSAEPLGLVSLARPSLKERGSGQTAIVELYQ